MNETTVKSQNSAIVNPGIDDSLKPDFIVYWFNKSTREVGNCTFFSYQYGVDIIDAVFKTMYPEREISKIKEISF